MNINDLKPGAPHRLWLVAPNLTQNFLATLIAAHTASFAKTHSTVGRRNEHGNACCPHAL